MNHTLAAEFLKAGNISDGMSLVSFGNARAPSRPRLSAASTRFAHGIAALAVRRGFGTQSVVNAERSARLKHSRVGQDLRKADPPTRAGQYSIK